MEKKTLVIGASTNPARYSYKAIKMLKAHQHPVVALGVDKGDVSGTAIVENFPEHEQVDTVTLYLRPERQKQYYDAILKLKPKRIIFNPGTENPEFEKMAAEKGINVEEACTLVLLSTGQF